MGREMGGSFKRKGIYVYLCLIHWPGLPSLGSPTQNTQTQEQACPYLILVDQQLGLAEEQVAVLPEP